MRLDFKNNPRLGKLVTIVLFGLLLLVIAFPIKDSVESGKEGSDVEDNQIIATAYGSTYYEERLKEILEKSYGSGTMSVMVNMTVTKSSSGLYNAAEEEERVDGVLVVADVTNANAISDITYAVCALFDLPVHKVAVILKE